METSPTTPEYFCQALERTSFNLAYALTDANENQKHITPIYNLDFSLLAPILFQSSAPGAKAFIPDVREVTSRVLGNSATQVPFTLAIGAPFYYEFVDQLHHKSEAILSVRDTLSHLNSGDIKRLLEEEISSTTKELLGKLELITDTGIEQQIWQPVSRLKTLLEDGKVHGLGDYISPHSLFHGSDVQIKFDEIVADMRAKRLQWDLSYRSEEDSMFHYRMDAANICFALYYQGGPRANNYYLTKEWPQIVACKRDGTIYGRYYITSLFLTNAALLKKDGYIRDHDGWLRLAFQDCRFLLNQLQDYRGKRDWEGMPGSLGERLKSFHDHTLSRLYNTDDAPPFQKNIIRNDELAPLLFDRSRLNNSIDKAHESVKAAIKVIPISPEKLGIAQIEEFNIQNDPVFKRICSSLNLSF